MFTARHNKRNTMKKSAILFLWIVVMLESEFGVSEGRQVHDNAVHQTLNGKSKKDMVSIIQARSRRDLSAGQLLAFKDKLALGDCTSFQHQVLDNEQGLSFAGLKIPVPVDYSQNRRSVYVAITTSSSHFTQVDYSKEFQFPIGTSYVYIVLLDGVGRWGKSCDFNVTVKDVEPPKVVSCEGPQVNNSHIFAIQNKSAWVNWSEPVFTDNSEKKVKVYTISGSTSGGYYGVGSYNSVYEATDESGNTANCSFTFTVHGPPCPLLKVPVNGAMVCEKRLHPNVCAPQCQRGYYPVYSNLNRPPKMYLCTVNGEWRLGGATIPDCKKMPSTSAVDSLPQFDGRCGDKATDTQIKKTAYQNLKDLFGKNILESLKANVSEFHVRCGTKNSSTEQGKKDTSTHPTVIPQDLDSSSNSCAPLGTPNNGALICDRNQSSIICSIQCEKGLAPHYPSGKNPHNQYFCNTRELWHPNSFIPDCYVKSKMNDPSYLTFDGDCQDSNAKRQIQTKAFQSLLNTLPGEVLIKSFKLSASDLEVQCGAKNLTVLKYKEKSSKDQEGKPCSALHVPSNGALVCDHERFPSLCSPICQDGLIQYYMSGFPRVEEFHCTLDGMWRPNNYVPDCSVRSAKKDGATFTGNCESPATQSGIRASIFQRLKSSAIGLSFLGATGVNVNDLHVECGL